MSCIFIIDEPIDGDGRINKAINDLCIEKNIEFINIMSINSDNKISAMADFILLLMFSSIIGFFKINMIFGYVRRGDGIFGGCRAALRLLWKSCKARAALRERMRNGDVDCVYAADLYCAVAALPAIGGRPVIYDSHELQFHRNRRTGWLRILLEVGLEKLVARRVDEIWAVNKPLARIITDLHAPTAPVKIRPNNFYPAVELPPPPDDAPLAITYVGKGTRGRRLEWLDVWPLPCEVHMFLLGAQLPAGIAGKGWEFGPIDYQEALAHVARSRRCFMWTVSELSCLSYRLALPNKFFQALAMGIPLIAVEGSYVADIVNEYQIGIVVSEDAARNLQDIVEMLDGLSYRQLSANVRHLSRQVSYGEIKL